MYGCANFIFTYGGSMYRQPYNATQTHSTLCKLCKRTIPCTVEMCLVFFLSGPILRHLKLVYLGLSEVFFFLPLL